MSDSAFIRPEFIRLPEAKTNCPYTGYSRTGLYNLCVPCKANGNRPAVPAKCDRKAGNLRGIWLIPYEPLISYIRALPTPGLVADATPKPEALLQRKQAGNQRARRAA